MAELPEKPVSLPDGQTIWIRTLPLVPEESMRNLKLCRLSIFLPEPCLRRAMDFAALSGIYTKSGAITHVLRHCIVKKEEPRGPGTGRAA
jgi:hypothetical protein